MQRTISHLANGVLIYAIFYVLAWAIALKGGLVLQVAFGVAGGPPDTVEELLVPFLTSLLAAFLAHAGLRLALKALRLTLAGNEATASHVFLGVLALLGFSGAVERLFGLPEADWRSSAAVLLGAWLGVALRRRIRL